MRDNVEIEKRNSATGIAAKFLESKHSVSGSQCFVHLLKIDQLRKLNQNKLILKTLSCETLLKVFCLKFCSEFLTIVGI